MKHRSGLAVTGGVIVLIFVLVAVFAPVLAPYDPQALSGQSLEAPSARHILGTNNIGQDLLSQLIFGARESLTVAIAGAGIALVAGVLVGVGPTLVGGAADTIAARLVDLFLAVPPLPLIFVIATFAPPTRPAMIAIIGFAGWAPIARILRSQSLSVRSRGFMTAAGGFGGGPLYLVRRHMVPALGPVIVTRFVDWAGAAIFLQAGLAFLGLADPTRPSWGLTLNRAVNLPGLYFSNIWIWWVLAPGLTVTLAVLGFAFVGVGMERKMNPRMSR